MTYDEIFEWIQSEYDFEPGESATDAFNTISDDWRRDNTDSLAELIGSERDDIIERIRGLIPGGSPVPEAEEDLEPLVRRVETIERELMKYLKLLRIRLVE